MTHPVDPQRVPRLVLAAPATGQGKTTAAAALMALLTRRGLRVAPFKVGPDYVDPSHHRAAAGRASRSLDGWLMDADALVSVFRRGVTGANAADVAVVEGMMGLFDGASAAGEGSTAGVALLLGAPVVLVVDAWTMAASAAAVVHGFHTFHPRLRLAGVVLNRAAGAAHYALCRDAIAASTDVPVLGWIPADAALAVPERHLGLVMADERGVDLDRLAERAGETLDVEGLLRIARGAGPLPEVADPLPIAVDGPPRAVVAVARDAAFGFYYEDNLDLLRAAGAELRFFSPIAGEALPEGAGALYLGGGYPELHAAALAANAAVRRAVSGFAASGRPVYAECGGLMYLSEALVDEAGVRHPMAGVVPSVSVMRGLTIGYREVVALADSPIARAGQVVRGHEFHHSVLEPPPASPAWRRVGGVETEGFIGGPRGNVLASYVHLHFASAPEMAARFVEAAIGRGG